MVTIGYLGPKGTFTEEALHYYQETLQEVVTTTPFHTIDDTMDACRKGWVDYAFVPVENSLGGSVLNTMDYMMDHTDIEICAEVVMPIRHYLWGIPGATLDAIQAVYSHPQALRQCKSFLTSQLSQATQHGAASTASAGCYVHTTGDAAMAAIGGEALGRTYELVKLTNEVQDRSDNMTRFLVVHSHPEREQVRIQSGDKLSILCEVDGWRPGALYEALGIFAKRNINLVRIESRPTKGRLGEYKFFFDLETKTGPENMQAALDELQTQATILHVLGAYHTLYVE